MLNIDEIKEIPDEIAKSWVKFENVVEYTDTQDFEALKRENEELKKQIEKQSQKQSKKTAKSNKKGQK